MNMTINRTEQTVTITKDALREYLTGYVIYENYSEWNRHNEAPIWEAVNAEFASITEDESDTTVTISYNQFLSYMQGYLELFDIDKDSIRPF